MKKLFVLMAHIPKASCSLYRRCCKIAVTKIKKKRKRKKLIILRFMIHKMFWIHMYLQCLANWLVVLKLVTVGFYVSALVFFSGVSKGLE